MPLRMSYATGTQRTKMRMTQQSPTPLRVPLKTLSNLGDTSGVLTTVADFRANFEGTPSYSLVVIARSGAAADDDSREMFTRLGVTVKVVDQEDDGTVEISALEPQVGSAVIATLKEEDKDVAGVVWQWFRGGDAETKLRMTLAGRIELQLQARAGNLCSDAEFTREDDRR